MPLSNNAFGDIPTGKPKVKPQTKPQTVVKTKVNPTESRKIKKRTPKPPVKKVNVTYSLPKSLRDEMQALSFVTRKSQSEIVSELIEKHLSKVNVDLPKRAA
jgi:hypothetical protein